MPKFLIKWSVTNLVHPNIGAPALTTCSGECRTSGPTAGETAQRFRDLPGNKFARIEITEA